MNFALNSAHRAYQPDKQASPVVAPFSGKTLHTPFRQAHDALQRQGRRGRIAQATNDAKPEFSLLREEVDATDGSQVLHFGFGTKSDTPPQAANPAPEGPQNPPTEDAEDAEDADEASLKQSSATSAQMGTVQYTTKPAQVGTAQYATTTQEPQSAGQATTSINDPVITEQAAEVAAKVEQAIKEESSVELPLVTSELNGHSAISERASTPEEATSMPPAEALMQLTVLALKNRCKNEGISGYSKMKKEELVDALMKHHTESLQIS